MSHPFKTGSIYANRIGKYEVVSVNAGQNTMVVRYLHTGAMDEVPLSLQERIWENMGLEEEEASARTAGAEPSRLHKGYGSGFAALTSADFKSTTENTTWRSRQGLTGKVARLLSVGTPFTFVSWAVYRWPVAFLTHHEAYNVAAFGQGSRKTKFTIEGDDSGLTFGLYVERSDGIMDESWDWPRVIHALRTNGKLQKLIVVAETKHDAGLIGRQAVGKEHFHFANGLKMGAQSLWSEDGESRVSVQERLERLNTIPEGHWGEMYIVRTLPKAAAIGAGIDVARQIAEFMRLLLPIYRSAL